MNIIKYDRVREGTILTNSTSNSSSNTTINVSSSSRGGERDIWGQIDEGEDVNGSMIINGNITINSIAPKEYEEDDDEDGEEIEEETGGGNLNVEYKITADEMEANEAYFKNHLYINYPHNGTKQCIIDILQSHIAEFNSFVITINNKITLIESEIENIKSRLEDLENGNGGNTPNPPTPPNPDEPDTEVHQIKVSINKDIFTTNLLGGCYLFKYGTTLAGLDNIYDAIPYEVMFCDDTSVDEIIYTQPIMAGCNLTVNVHNGETVQISEGDSFEVYALENQNWYYIGSDTLIKGRDYEFAYTLQWSN